jgi:hypothetical protein
MLKPDTFTIMNDNPERTPDDQTRLRPGEAASPRPRRKGLVHKLASFVSPALGATLVLATLVSYPIAPFRQPDQAWGAWLIGLVVAKNLVLYLALYGGAYWLFYGRRSRIDIARHAAQASEARAREETVKRRCRASLLHPLPGACQCSTPKRRSFIVIRTPPMRE